MKKNILIVTAHPGSTGLTHAIAEKYKTGKESKGYKVDLVDLYRTDLKQDFLSFGDEANDAAPDIQQQWQQKIRWSDEIVLVYPVWRGDCPAIMKNWFDCNFSSGFAFKYTNKFPVGLLKGKTAKIFCTCDGPKFIYKFFPISFLWYWRLFRLGFCSIKLKHVYVFDQIRKRKKQEKGIEKLLEKVTRIAKK